MERYPPGMPATLSFEGTIGMIPPPKCSVRELTPIAADVVIPASAGVYFWWFKNIDLLFTEEMVATLLRLDSVQKSDEYYLLYVGIAAKQTLAERILEKHLVSANVSTLRHTIGSLLAYRAGIPVDQSVTVGRFAISTSEFQVENRVSDFFAENARLSWSEIEECGELERRLLGIPEELSLPLNIKDNLKHPFARRLRDIRTQYARRSTRSARRIGARIESA